MYSILIVEDDMTLCKQLAEGLDKWGFVSITVENFENIQDEFIKNKPQLVIMDINLPCFDGFHWCRKIREVSKVPVIFLSSRDTNMDIVMAVNTGADDYITKPFSMQVLVAKIQAVLRRTYDYTSGSPELVEHNGLILNVSEGNISYKGQKLELTKNELKILTLLLNNKGKVVTRESIMQLLWNDDVFVNENTLTVNINRLRGKLEELELSEFISTKKRQGYIII